MSTQGVSGSTPLTSAHDVSEFDCGVAALNDWLRSRALRSEGRSARTYVMCTGQTVVGYFCVSAGTIERGSAPGRLRRNAPDPIPISIIGRLAVDKAYHGKGIGADLLADAFARIVSASQVIGISAILVHAKDDLSRTFYLKHAEFLEYPADSRTLFLPIETIVAAL
jgi:GNAT superfamily N-acetyltransferase